MLPPSRKRNSSRRLDGFLHALHQGENRYAYNALDGVYEGHPVWLFDYHYEIETTDSDGEVAVLEVAYRGMVRGAGLEPATPTVSR